MGLSTFIGGVHPYEGKELSSDKPIQVIQPKGELVFPLSQHIGAPAKPLVAKGDTVLAGQKLSLIHISTLYLSYPVTWVVTGAVHIACFLMLKRKLPKEDAE